ncbi:hypothetical protein AAG747_12850 [Rapidithrix thailandica]|uniref:Uncharacterized protein n=1 Tax=Rapidithrix thailandica TaxID=413964 RepID=A0AAW9RV80_9BACT
MYQQETGKKMDLIVQFGDLGAYPGFLPKGDSSTESNENDGTLGRLLA